MKNSLQAKLARVRPPRVQLAFDVESNGAISRKELPYVVGAIADLNPSERAKRSFSERAFAKIDLDTFDAFLADVAPSVSVKTADGQDATLRFSRMEDFEPHGLVELVPEMAKAHHLAQHHRDLLSCLDGNDAFLDLLVALTRNKKRQDALASQLDAGSGPTLDEVLWASGIAIAGDPPARVAHGIQILSAVLPTLRSGTGDPETDAVARIATLDADLSRDLNSILRHPDFRALEAVWRGLWRLVANSETGPDLTIRVLDVSKTELLADFEAAKTPQESVLFHRVKNQSYGAAVADPFSVLIGCYEFDLGPEDLALLERIRTVASNAVCPFISALTPALSKQPLNSEERARWSGFRAHEDGWFVHLCAPHVLLRLPYGPNGVQSELPNFEEDTASGEPADFLWGNPVWHLAERITRSVSDFGWPASIYGSEQGGFLENIPHPVRSEFGQMGSLETYFSADYARAMDVLGFVTASVEEGTQTLAFFANPGSDAEGAHVSLPRVLAATRVAQCTHHLFCLHVAELGTAENIEHFLGNWIAQYVLLDDDAPNEVKARHPLKSAQITVADVPDDSTALRTEISVEPHFMLQKPTQAMRFAAVWPDVL